MCLNSANRYKLQKGCFRIIEMIFLILKRGILSKNMRTNFMYICVATIPELVGFAHLLSLACST